MKIVALKGLVWDVCRAFGLGSQLCYRLQVWSYALASHLTFFSTETVAELVSTSGPWGMVSSRMRTWSGLSFLNSTPIKVNDTLCNSKHLERKSLGFEFLLQGLVWNKQRLDKVMKLSFERGIRALGYSQINSYAVPVPVNMYNTVVQLQSEGARALLFRLAYNYTDGWCGFVKHQRKQLNQSVSQSGCQL